MVPPIYSDGISAPTKSIKNTDLPSALLVSKVVTFEKYEGDCVHSLANAQWGQMVAHDISLSSNPSAQGINTFDFCYIVHAILLIIIYSFLLLH